MMRLTLSVVRALLGRWGWAVGPVWVLAAALLAFDPVLGASTLGSYLAYVAPLPMVLLWRLGRLRRQRRAEGWSAEERLRDQGGRRAPLAEAAGSALTLGGALLLAMAPALFPVFDLPRDDASLHPVLARPAESGWRLDFPTPLPAGSTLLLTFAYDSAPPDLQFALTDGHAVRADAVPGEVLRWRLHEEDLRAGSAVLQPVDPQLAEQCGARLLGVLARVAVPRPGSDALPGLLARLLLAILALIGVLLLLERVGRVDGVLAAVTALLLGALAATRLDDAAALPDTPLGWIADAVLALRGLLPDVSGLYAVGHRFELRAGTASPGATLAWLALGALALALACLRRRPRA